MDKIMSNLIAYNSGTLRHLAEGLEIQRRFFFQQINQTFFKLPTKWTALVVLLLKVKAVIRNSDFMIKKTWFEA